MPRRRLLPPDNRLDWRDPDMPVYMKSNKDGMVLKTSKFASEIAARRLEMIPAPHFSKDPTYHLNRRTKPND